MKLNNKGFVSSTLMYSLLILFLFLILGLIALLSNRKMILDKLKNDIKEEVNSTKKYRYYEDGTVIYYNPVTNKLCGNYTESNSLNETKTGCLKWYIFNDDINRSSVNMILDHNTTYKVAWNSTNNNSGGMKEVKDELDALVNQSKWKIKPRLISADEIAKITGAQNEINWSSRTMTSSNWFCLDSNEKDSINFCAKSQGISTYKWLFNYTYGCTSYGCDTVDSNTVGYWTSSIVFNHSGFAWLVHYHGFISDASVSTNNSYGVRPVISVSKKDLKFGGTKVNKTTNDTHKGIIYMDPTNLNKTCTEQLATANVDSTTNLLTGIKKGCMKFYIFDDSDDKYKLILDHNTTATVAYETSGIYKEYAQATIKTQVDSDTAGWLLNPRFISADEVAKITGADTEKSWSSSTATTSDYFCLDTNENDSTSWCAKSLGTSNYKWLFNYTNDCTRYGCDTTDSSTNGLWTSSSTSNSQYGAWYVSRNGILINNSVNTNNSCGIRPVVELYKSVVN